MSVSPCQFIVQNKRGTSKMRFHQLVFTLYQFHAAPTVHSGRLKSGLRRDVAVPGYAAPFLRLFFNNAYYPKKSVNKLVGA